MRPSVPFPTALRRGEIYPTPSSRAIERPESTNCVEKRMARPVCKGVCRDRRLISLLQRIRPRRSLPGQDGDTRALVLINSSASCAAFNSRLPERRLTVRPSRRHPLANSACTTGAFAPTERIPTRPRIPPWRQTVSRAAAPPRRSSPACWAKATTTTLRWVLLISPFTHRPSGVSRSAT